MKVDRLERLTRLGELRYEKKLSQDKVAELLGIQRPQYTLYETGKREIPVKYLRVLARTYGVSIDYIVGETNIRNRN
jgi:transcriptional regulator with XRE-family HTH domain